MTTVSPLMVLFPIAVALAFMALVYLAVRAEVRGQSEPSRHLTATLVSVVILALFYPMTIAPTGTLSNGGVIGFGSLVIAAILF